MAKITFITQSGEKTNLEASSGSLMELAVKNNIKGIDGDCGGVCSCATCHVHIEPSFWEKCGEMDEMEKDMLELSENPSEFSRLSCQIQISEELDGIQLQVAR